VSSPGTREGEQTPQPGADGPSDEQVIAAIAQGDHDALGVLYDRYHRLAMGVAYRVLNDHATSEDVVHDAFLTVWRRGDSFNPSRGNARSWLLTIVRNAAIDRRRGRHARALQDAPLDDVAFLLASEKEEIFASVAAKVEAERVRDALTELPIEQREAIELAYFRGLTQHEIADQTGAALGTVKGRMRLGLRKLRGSLFDLGPTTGSPAGAEDVGTEARPDRPSIADIARRLLGLPWRRSRVRTTASPI
jgi:RNA polymerase sigma-70 factor (ECF subfamily)